MQYANATLMALGANYSTRQDHCSVWSLRHMSNCICTHVKTNWFTYAIEFICCSFLRNTVWSGPLAFNSAATSPTPPLSVGNPSEVILDISGMIGRFKVSSGSFICFQRITLTGLQISNTTIPAGPPRSTLSLPATVATALPLWFIDSADRSSVSSSPILLDSVSLMLPLPDFGALYAFAQVGGANKLQQERSSAQLL